MGIFRNRTERDKQQAKIPQVPEQIQVAAELGGREKILAAAQDDHTSGWVLVTSWRLVVVVDSPDASQPEHEPRLRIDRPWFEVDGGSWDPDTATLSVSWVGAGAGAQWALDSSTGPGRVPEAFRERVSASVVLTQQIDLGPRRTARIAIRENLADRSLVEQVIPGRGYRADDEELVRAMEASRIDLRDQVGLPASAD